MSLPISIGMLSTFLFQVVVKFRSLVKVADEGFVWEPPPETPLELDVSFISGADAIIEDAEKAVGRGAEKIAAAEDSNEISFQKISLTCETDSPWLGPQYFLSLLKI